jgi:hypothetical protein
MMCPGSALSSSSINFFRISSLFNYRSVFFPNSKRFYKIACILNL